MTRKKSKTTQAKIAARRLVEDEEVQKNLRVAGLRVRQAVASLATAGTRLRKQPEPPKHTGRKVFLGAALAAGAAYALKKKRADAPATYEPQATTPTGAVPAPTPPTPVTVS